MYQTRGAELDSSVKKNLDHTKTERQRVRKGEDRGTSGERSPPSGNLQTRKRNSVRERETVTECVCASGTFLTSCRKAGTHLSSYSEAKNTGGDVRINHCTGRVLN